MLVPPVSEIKRLKRIEHEKHQNQVIKGLLNNFDEEKVEGDNLTIDDCAIAPLKEFKICGKDIKQEIRQGYNIINEKSLAIKSPNYDNMEKIEDEVYTTKVASGFGNFRPRFDTVKFEANETYYLSADIKLLLGQPGGIMSTINIMNADSSNILNKQTLTDIIPNINEYQRLIVKVDVGDTSFLTDGLIIQQNRDSVDTQLLIKNIQISRENKEYEKFGASPSTEFPSPLEYVEGNQEVEHLKINLLPNFRTTITTQGKTFTANEDGSVTTSGSSNAYCQAIDSNSFLLKAGTYTFWNNLTTNYFQTQLRSEDGLKIYVSSTGDKIVFSLTEDTVLKYRIICYANISINQTIKSMILPGDYTNKDNIEYQEYQSKTYQLTNLPEMYSKKDKIVYLKDGAEGEGWYVYNTLAKVSFRDLDLNITSLDNNSRWGAILIDKSINNIKINNKDTSTNITEAYSNIGLANVSQTGVLDTGYKIAFSQFGNSKYIFFSKDFGKTASEVKTNIEADDNYIIYELETPIYTKITDSVLIEQLNNLQKMILYEGTNHFIITAENGQSANLKVIAYKRYF